jgi:hypothetical protein
VQREQKRELHVVVFVCCSACLLVDIDIVRISRFSSGQQEHDVDTTKVTDGQAAVASYGAFLLAKLIVDSYCDPATGAFISLSKPSDFLDSFCNVNERLEATGIKHLVASCYLQPG